jgi:hypothetical protein
MYFARSNRAIREADDADTLELAPTPETIRPAQPLQLSDTGSDGDDFDLGDLADDFDIHDRLAPQVRRRDPLALERFRADWQYSEVLELAPDKVERM